MLSSGTPLGTSQSNHAISHEIFRICIETEFFNRRSHKQSVKGPGYMPGQRSYESPKSVRWTAPRSSVQMPGYQAPRQVDAPSGQRARL